MASWNEKALAASVDSRQAASWPPYGELPPGERLKTRMCIAYLVLLTLLFLGPLTGLAQHAAHSEIHSHILLTPFICGYLLYVRRRQSQARYRRSITAAIVAAGFAVAAFITRLRWSADLSRNDDLALMTFAFVGLVAAGGFLFLGAEWMAANAFPVAFLIF